MLLGEITVGLSVGTDFWVIYDPWLGLFLLGKNDKL